MSQLHLLLFFSHFIAYSGPPSEASLCSESFRDGHTEQMWFGFFSSSFLWEKGRMVEEDI